MTNIEKLIGASESYFLLSVLFWKPNALDRNSVEQRVPNRSRLLGSRLTFSSLGNCKGGVKGSSGRGINLCDVMGLDDLNPIKVL